MHISKLRLTGNELNRCSVRAQPMTAAAELQLAKTLWAMLDWLQDREFVWVARQFEEILAESGIPRPSQDDAAPSPRQEWHHFQGERVSGGNVVELVARLLTDPGLVSSPTKNGATDAEG